MEIKGHYLRSKACDMRLNEWERAALIMQDNEKDTIEKYTDSFILLGLPEKVLNELTIPEFSEIIKQFNEDSATDFAVMVKDFEIDGYKYVAFDTLRVKDLKIISKYQATKSMYAGEMMAVCFKREDLSDAEHYADAHIKHKAKLFREHLTADVCVPYIMAVTEQMVKSINTNVAEDNGSAMDGVELPKV